MRGQWRTSSNGPEASTRLNFSGSHLATGPHFEYLGRPGFKMRGLNRKPLPTSSRLQCLPSGEWVPCSTLEILAGPIALDLRDAPIDFLAHSRRHQGLSGRRYAPPHESARGPVVYLRGRRRVPWSTLRGIKHLAGRRYTLPHESAHGTVVDVRGQRRVPVRHWKSARVP